MAFKKNIFFFFLAITLVCGGGCVPLGIVAVSGTLVATTLGQQRGVSGIAMDARIKKSIVYRWKQHGFSEKNLRCCVYGRRVILIGHVDSISQKEWALTLAKKTKETTHIYNHIAVQHAPPSGPLKDKQIAIKIRAALLANIHITSRNYSVQAYQNVVYVVGVAQTPLEKEKVLFYLRHAPNVRGVIHYIHVL